MIPVAAAKKRSKFDLKTFLSTIDGGRTIAAISQKADHLCSGRLGRFSFLHTGGKSKTDRSGHEREGSHYRHSE